MIGYTIDRVRLPAARQCLAAAVLVVASIAAGWDGFPTISQVVWTVVAVGAALLGMCTDAFKKNLLMSV